ncbi:integron integrase [Alcanivorax sp. S71-1-4]|uniref:phage integrase N-terminal SAM-like domain-containing protein n=1 Tax=Alcanivorax sp. S71-1-4 TaxID=1177159 RepID=UPI00168FD9FD|nr:phage integrase N-terminal SAM-like domain-containing protein [Alcanivorax sp. S71-1-4]KAF0804616.1 integron integrase [Alcanivorax sp. S71-1-4]
MRTDSRRQPKLHDQFRNTIRVRHYSVRTEKTYWYWIRYFIRFNRMRYPSEITEPQVSAFLT